MHLCSFFIFYLLEFVISYSFYNALFSVGLYYKVCYKVCFCFLFFHSVWLSVQWEMWLQCRASAVEQEEGLCGEHGWYGLPVGCWSGPDWKLHMPRLYHWWHWHLTWPPLLGFSCGAKLLHGESRSGVRLKDEWVVPQPPWHQQPKVSLGGYTIKHSSINFFFFFFFLADC